MRTIIAERKRARTDNEQTITPESAYAGSNRGAKKGRPGPTYVKPGLTPTSVYQALHGTFHPLSPLSGSSVSFLMEFLTITTSPTIEPA